MNKKVREPFLIARICNLILGLVILVLFAITLIKEERAGILSVVLFALAAIENFIAATIHFSEQKKVRGNVYAVICAVFLIMALILAVRYFVFV